MKSFKTKGMLLFLLMLPLKYATASETIIEVESMSQIPFESFTSKDCIAFDLDDTTFIQKEKIMRNANLEARNAFIEEIREQAGNERVSFLYANSEYQLVEDCLRDEIEKLNERDVTTFGLTVRRTGKATEDQVRAVEDDTLRLLYSLDVQYKSNYFQNMTFTGMNPNNIVYTEFIVDTHLRPFALPHDVMVKDAVAFTNNLDKGLVLGEIFNQSDFFPETFALIDDKKANLTSVEEAIKKINEKFGKNIKIKLYYYTKASKLDNALNQAVVDLQKAELLKDNPRFLSEQEALKILGL